jgi:histidinol-phosphate aminotransferase
MSKPYRLLPLIESLPSAGPFTGPETQERMLKRRFRARIGANECVFGPSPKAIEVMAREGAEIWKYGDPEGYEIRHAIARHYGVEGSNVVMGPGIDGLLGYAARMFVEPGVSVVTSLGAYPTFNEHVTSRGGTLHRIPFRDDKEDLEALLDAARRYDARLLYISNPDNPMGTWHDAAAITQLIERLPAGCVLLLDEAYLEFAWEGVAPPIDIDDPRVLRLRTFSKAYGMAGARVGYAVGEKGLIAEFERVRDYYVMNRTAEFGAIAALADGEWLAQSVRRTREACERIARIARDNGLKPIASATNFVTMDCLRDTAHARNILQGLLEEGVFVRMPGAEPLSRCIRVTAGLPQDLDVFEETLPRVLKRFV